MKRDANIENEPGQKYAWVSEWSLLATLFEAIINKLQKISLQYAKKIRSKDAHWEINGHNIVEEAF